MLPKRSLRLVLLSAVFALIAHSDSRAAAVVSCRDCHGTRIATGEVRMASATRALAVVEQADDVYGRHCQACHRSDASLENISPGHRAASHYYHHAGTDLAELAPEDPCMACHGGGEIPEITALLADLAEAPPRFHREATHPMQSWDSAPVRNTGYTLRPAPDERLLLVDDRVSCISCHNLGSGTDFALSDLGGRNQLCLGCHVRAEGFGRMDLALDDSHLR